MLGPDGDPGAVRLGRMLGAPVVSRGRSVLWGRAEVVFVRLPVDELRHAAVLATLAGVSAAVAVPFGAPAPLPWWGRRYHRILVPSQDAARAWGATGVALGRLVVVGEGEGPDEVAALRAVVDEVRAAALGPDIRPRAR